MYRYMIFSSRTTKKAKWYAYRNQAQASSMQPRRVHESAHSLEHQQPPRLRATKDRTPAANTSADRSSVGPNVISVKNILTIKNSD